jgi:hypothetical protein
MVCVQSVYVLLALRQQRELYDVDFTTSLPLSLFSFDMYANPHDDVSAGGREQKMLSSFPSSIRLSTVETLIFPVAVSFPVRARHLKKLFVRNLPFSLDHDLLRVVTSDRCALFVVTPRSSFETATLIDFGFAFPLADVALACDIRNSCGDTFDLMFDLGSDRN